jgi:lactoylglutathione lyase
MPRVTAINHVTLIVDDLEKAAAFYEQELGLEPLPAYNFDYPVAFFKVNETQQLHVTEWEDTPSFRGHVCVRVDDWGAAFKRYRELGIIDVRPWGKVRKLPDGTFQMFIRDPSGNLIEISAPPGSKVDESIFQSDDLCQSDVGPYVSERNDGRGPRSDDASLYHSDEARH